VGLGSSLGDRAGYLRAALSALAAIPGIKTKPQWTSRIYETTPVGADGADPPFLNAVVRIETSLSPCDLLAALLSIEAQLGRTRDGRAAAPRTIDLDLLLYDNIVVRIPHLHVPHPRLSDRRFVLEPLCDLCPELAIPDSGHTIRGLADNCRRSHPEQIVTILKTGLWP